ncbi:hypothetical protein BCR36DRAFT_226376, partial [Piromyces finnis]
MPSIAIENTSMIPNKRKIVALKEKSLKVPNIQKNIKSEQAPLNGPKLSNRALEIQKEEFLLSK